MPMASFPHLFEPLKLGAHTVRNRLFFPPHGTSLGDQGVVGDRHHRLSRGARPWRRGQ